jgi:hypothetical protein
MLAPKIPPPHPTKRRRVTFPLYQKASSSLFDILFIGTSLFGAPSFLPLDVPRASASWAGASPAQSAADHVGKGLQLGLRHVVAAGEVMPWEQERVLDAGLLSRLQE